jgi:teichoic acid glycerol-phosphate primase
MTAQSRAAGLIYDPHVHHLDHLGPLCALMGIPLLVTEKKIEELALKYYPNLTVVLCDYMTLSEWVVSHFEILFYSMPRDLFDEIFFFAQKLLQKKVHTIWCPHGNSDKGAQIFYMEALKKEEAALLYGKQMIDYFQRKNVYDQLKGHVLVGNYRHAFYLENKAYYDALAEREIQRKLPKAEKTLLYAPTWQDYESSTSFFDAASPLIEKLPSRHNLIIKLHPNLVLQEEFKVEALIDKYSGRDNVLFLTEFTPVYPILQLADIYIGDMSSIGYDFLTFNRPMFFLNQNARDAQNDAGLYLFRCGIEIPLEDYPSIHKMIDNYFKFELRNFAEIRKEVYDYAFGHPKPLQGLKKGIAHLYALFPETGLNFF